MTNTSNQRKVICDNFYYENGKRFSFIEPLDVAMNFVWLRGSMFLYAMESKKPTGDSFQYIDIDSIDNSKNTITRKIIPTSKAPSRASRKVFKESSVFSMVRPYLRNIAFVGLENADAIASTGFYVCTPMPFVLPEYLFMLLKSDYVVNGLNFFMKGDNSPSINGSNIENFLFPIPSLSYQQKVLNTYSQIEKLLNTLNENIDDLKSYVESAKYKILDSIFGENSSYKSYYEKTYKLGEILIYEQPGPYIVSSTNYSDSFEIPVLTPGKTFILGYTNEKEGIYHPRSKVIIFDDFTTASRIVDFDFKVKSSAMKILHSIDENLFNIEYLYYYLQTIKMISDTHKRFWISEFAHLAIKIHTFNEQLEIVKYIKNTFLLIDNISK